MGEPKPHITGVAMKVDDRREGERVGVEEEPGM